MNLQTALSQMSAPKGLTSVIEGVMRGDFDPLQPQNAVGKSLEEARAKLASVREAQAACKSDWAYWGYEGDAAYWTATVSILTAAELVGPDNLPDVPAPPTSGVVMDLCSAVERYGREILKRAKAQGDSNA